MTTAICTTASGATASRINWKRMLHMFMSFLAMFLAVTLFTSCKKGAGDLKKGFSSMEKGKYEDARKSFKESAEKGNTDAQMMLAVCYAVGMGVEEPDLEEAEKQLKKAAKAEDPVAQAAYGMLLLSQSAGDKEAKEDAADYIEKSAKQDCVFGQLALALYSAEEEHDMDAALKNLKKVAEHSLTKKKIFLDDAKMGLVKYALEEYADTKDDDVVEGILEVIPLDKFTVTDLCIVGSQGALYVLYSVGMDDIEADKEEAEKWLKKAKKNGLPKQYVAALKIVVAQLQKEQKEREEMRKKYSSYDDDDYYYGPAKAVEAAEKASLYDDDDYDY